MLDHTRLVQADCQVISNGYHTRRTLDLRCSVADSSSWQDFSDSFVAKKKKKTRERVGVFISQPLFLICSSCISKVTLGPRFTVISWTRFLVPRDFTFLQRRPMKRAVMHLSLARLRRGPLRPSPYYFPTNALYANQTVFKMFAILLTC